MHRGPATGQAAAWPTSCCPLGKDGQLEREQGSLSCWQPPGAPGQGQEWGWEKDQGVQGGARTGPKSWGCWTAGARCVSSLRGQSSPGNSGFQPIPATWCPSEPLPQSGLPAVLQSWEPRAVTTPISPQDFLRCVTAALIYFAISITAVAKYSDGASKAAGVSSHPSPGRGCPAMPPQVHPCPDGNPDAPWTLSIWGRVCPRLGPLGCHGDLSDSKVLLLEI